MYPGLPCSLKSGQRKRHILHHKSRNYGVQEQKKTGMQDYYMFAVADQPYLKSQSVIKLIDKVLEIKEI